MTRPPVETLPVGHHARPSLALTLRYSVVNAVAFTVFAYLTTQWRSVRKGSPWQDDPYDTVVSFTMYFVPLLAVMIVLRAVLCRKSDPVPLYRVEQLLRASLVCSVLVTATVVADWVAVALRADGSLWNPGTPWLIASLALLTGSASIDTLLRRRAWRGLPRRAHRHADGDWLDDVVPLLEVFAGRFPRAGGPLAQRMRRSDAIGLLRRYFRPFAAACALAAGLVIAGALAREDGFNAPFFVIATLVFAGGAFSFAMICDAVLRLTVPRDAGTMRRAARVAGTVGALALPVSLGLRDIIWSAIGRSGSVSSTGQLAAVTLTSALLASVTAFASSLARARRPR